MSWMELRHWAMIVGAMLCVWAAALAKEIGITVTATVVLYDAFLVPFDRVQPPRCAAQSYPTLETCSTPCKQTEVLMCSVG